MEWQSLHFGVPSLLWPEIYVNVAVLASVTSHIDCYMTCTVYEEEIIFVCKINNNKD